MSKRFDAVSSFNETGTLASGTSKFSIAGRVRLFSVWLSNGNNVTSGVLQTLTLRTGSDSGEEILKFDTRFIGNLNTSFPNFVIPGGGIIFEDGLYFDTGNDSVANINSVTLIYQLGG
jgi:hypothetical protein